MFTVAVNGGYPRDPEPPRPQLLRMALEAHQARTITDKELHRAGERAAVEMIAEMIAGGVEVVSDGYATWPDPVAAVCAALGGFAIGSPALSGGTSTGEDAGGTAQPIASEPIRWVKPIALERWRFLAERSPVDVRAVLPGPFTMALSCDPGIYGDDRARLCRDLAAALHRELEGLDAAGAQLVLIEEPLLCLHKDEPRLFREAADILCDRIKASVMLGTSGGDILGLESEIAASPFGGVAFDLVNGPNNDLLFENDDLWGEKIIQLGLVDGASETVEESDAIVQSLLKFAAVHNPGLIWVAPNAGMQSLPRDIAFEKLRRLYHSAITARREVARQESFES